jgi:hypothetical protein
VVTGSVKDTVISPPEACARRCGHALPLFDSLAAFLAGIELLATIVLMAGSP